MDQLRKMNEARKRDNVNATKFHHIKPFSRQEFWTFFGLMLASKLYGGNSGESIFDGEVEEGLAAEVNIFNLNVQG